MITATIATQHAAPTQYQGIRMFPTIEGFDDWVLGRISDIKDDFVVVVCEIEFHRSNGAAPSGKQWGVYIKSSDPDKGPLMSGFQCNNREVRQCLIDEARRIVTLVARAEAQIHYFNYRVES